MKNPAGKIAVALIATFVVVIVALILLIFPSDEESEVCPPGGAPAATFPPGTTVKPIKGGTYQLTSGFGPRWGTMHNGQDFGSAAGEPIYATADGVVSESGPASGFGQWIVIDHNVDGQMFSSVYGHMFAEDLMVKAGDQVRAGQQIAKVGYNGEVSPPGPGGAHLHFEIWQGGRNGGEAVDPTGWLADAAEPDAPVGAAPAPTAPQRQADGDLPPLPESVGSEAHWQVDTIRVARAVAQKFPEVKTIGGWRPVDAYDDHPSGRAADIMIPDYNTGGGKELGDRIVEYLMANKAAFHLEYLIWRQQYILADGPSNLMEDRGSDTQNHFDHVHATTVGGGMPDTMTSYGTAPGAPGGPGAVPVPCGPNSAVTGGEADLAPGRLAAEFEPWVIKAGNICPQIRPPLIAAQIRQESGFDKNAVSPGGAQGPAQFMPGTWPGYGKDDDGNGQVSPFDVGDAVMAQGRYMCEIAGQVDAGVANHSIKAPNGAVELYLAAYNAGFGAVQSSGGFPTGSPDYVNQTRPYADQIQQYATEYAAVA
ncbi:peptidoglycan DD-metalloendopeptidase family protein [Rhodococcus koreensis]